MDVTYNICILGELSGWLQRALKPLVCFKYCKLGHIAVWCTSGVDSGDSGLVNGQVRCNGVGHWARYNIKIMKKSKLNSVAAKKKTQVKVEEKETENTDNVPVPVDSLDDEEQGFGGWLRSSDGLDTMKLFVIANSIVMLTTIVYPHAHAVFEIVSDMIYGTDILYDE